MLQICFGIFIDNFTIHPLPHWAYFPANFEFSWWT